MKRNLYVTLLTVACLGGFIFEDCARASTLTFQFGVNATSGPLAGASATGTFSYDSSIIPSSGSGVLNTANLFTSLNFTWDGIHYNQTTANTGFIVYANGAAISYIFGSDCSAGVCAIADGTENWIVDLFPPIQGVSGTINYTVLGHLGSGFGTAAITPLPGALPLFAGGLGALGLLGWHRKRKATV
jgi:hypothetical protein